MRERIHPDAVNDPDNNAWHGWSENDWRFSMVGQTRARIELSMALCRGRWEITVAVIGFLTAGLISAFLPLVLACTRTFPMWPARPPCSPLG